MEQRPSLRRLLIEGVAIVLSILLAFGIEAWWQDLGEREEEGRVLTALLGEFRTNEQRLDQQVAWHADVMAATNALLSAAADPMSNLSADSVDHLLGGVSWWGGSTSIEMAAVDAVILGGKLALIQDEYLRGRLTGWSRTIEETRQNEDQDYETYAQVWMPFLRANAYLPQVLNAITHVPGTSDPNYSIPSPLLPEAADHRPLLRDREFQNILLQKRLVQDDILCQYELLRPKLFEIMDLITVQLGG